MKLSQLFKNCAYDVKYKTVGNDVNYAFVEEGDIAQIKTIKDIKPIRLCRSDAWGFRHPRGSVKNIRHRLNVNLGIRDEINSLEAELSMLN